MAEADLNSANLGRGGLPLPIWLRWLVAVVTVVSLFLAMDAMRLFASRPLLEGLIQLENHYYYALLGLLLPLVYLLFPPAKGVKHYYFDIPLALAALGASVFLFINTETMLDYGWEFMPPTHAVWVSAVVWVLTLEAVRRCGGWTLFVLVLFFSVYPMVADHMPGPISGLQASPAQTAAYHVISIESILGLPFRAFATLVIGFVIFGIALQQTGGGRFFINLAFALLGRVRGGSAKVAIMSSGLMGSMSGSVITNVLSTGQMTIPAMKRSGFKPHDAGGIEACASTGGVLLPPIMGSTAFVMATFLNVPYTQVALAAAIPALLYFFGLFVQIDAYAARNNLSGAAEEELPSLRQTLLDGWFYVGAFVVLIVLLVYLQREAMAPFIATGVLLVLNQFSGKHRWNFEQLIDFLVASGRLLVELLAILAGVGLIVGALSMTGLSGTLVNDLLYLAGDAVWLLLLMGALTSFVLGIGMTVTAAYIFLAIVLAPALIQGGLNAMSVHLFILYWGMLSFITPPVALGAFAAASIAGASQIRTGFAAMSIGSVIYLIPFFFVLDPALVLDASPGEVVLALLQAATGVWLIAGAIQAYLPGVGVIGRGMAGFTGRLATAFGGVAIALPGLEAVGLALGDGPLLVIGLSLAGLGILLCLSARVAKVAHHDRKAS